MPFPRRHRHDGLTTLRKIIDSKSGDILKRAVNVMRSISLLQIGRRANDEPVTPEEIEFIRARPEEFREDSWTPALTSPSGAAEAFDRLMETVREGADEVVVEGAAERVGEGSDIKSEVGVDGGAEERRDARVDEVSDTRREDEDRAGVTKTAGGSSEEQSKPEAEVWWAALPDGSSESSLERHCRNYCKDEYRKGSGASSSTTLTPEQEVRFYQKVRKSLGWQGSDDRILAALDEQFETCKSMTAEEWRKLKMECARGGFKGRVLRVLGK